MKSNYLVALLYSTAILNASNSNKDFNDAKLSAEPGIFLSHDEKLESKKTEELTRLVKTSKFYIYDLNPKYGLEKNRNFAYFVYQKALHSKSPNESLWEAIISYEGIVEKTCKLKADSEEEIKECQETLSYYEHSLEIFKNHPYLVIPVEDDSIRSLQGNTMNLFFPTNLEQDGIKLTKNGVSEMVNLFLNRKFIPNLTLISVNANYFERKKFRQNTDPEIFIKRAIEQVEQRYLDIKNEKLEKLQDRHDQIINGLKHYSEKLKNLREQYYNEFNEFCPSRLELEKIKTAYQEFFNSLDMFLRSIPEEEESLSIRIKKAKYNVDMLNVNLTSNGKKFIEDVVNEIGYSG